MNENNQSGQCRKIWDNQTGQFSWKTEGSIAFRYPLLARKQNESSYFSGGNHSNFQNVFFSEITIDTKQGEKFLFLIYVTY